MRRKSSAGFTLVELLVVIAIMSIIAMLLLPGLRTIRARAYKAKCTSNLRELHKAFAMYVADEHVFPETITTPPPANDPYGKTKTVYWDSLINKYLKGKVTELRKCPTAIEVHKKTTVGTIALNGKVGGLAFGGARPGRKPLPPERASKTILLGDGHWTGKSIWAENGTWGGIDYASSRPDFEHSGTANFIFCDSHVEAMDPSSALQPYLWDPLNYPEPGK